MKPTPAGWPRIAPGLYYRDAAAMIDWLCQAFGFSVRLKVLGDDGRVRHSELALADGLIMVGMALDGPDRRFETDLLSPLDAGGNTQNPSLREVSGPPLREPWCAGPECQAARAGGAARARGERPESKARRVRGRLCAPPPGAQARLGYDIT